ncbi:MAG: translocation/assembly module TamB domain-containing protein, partial [Ginsengibacter sp.]
KIDTMKLYANNKNGLQELSVKTGFLYADIKGQYQLTQLGDVFQQIIDPYFSFNEKKKSKILSPYQFNIDISANDHPVLRALFPNLKQMKPIALVGNFSSDTGWSVFAKAPYVAYGNHILKGGNILAHTKNGEKLKFKTSFDNYHNGTTFNIYASSLEGIIQNNKIDFDLKIKDKESIEKYTLGGIISIPTPNNYSLSLKPDNLLLNYEKWKVASGNSIQYIDSNILAKDFILSRDNQKLSINSHSQQTNSPLQIDFTNFQIKTLSALAQQDSLLVNGLMNGKITVKNLQKNPIFLADITVIDLSIYQDTIGNLTAKIDNEVNNKYHADASLNGRGNQVKIRGDYWVDPVNSRFDFALDIPKFQVKSLEGFSKGAIRDSRGFLFGNVKVSGDFKNPNIDGKINFDNTSFNITTLNSVFRIDKEAIAIINNKGIEFDKFTIRDTINNSMTLSGMANSTNFINYQFNMNLRARNFQAINSTKKDNQLFYGKMVFSTNLKINGTPTHPIVDGDFTVEDNTDFTVVLPQGNQGIESREGIVRFVDRSATAEDSLFMRPYDSLNVSQLIGYDVSVNINVKNKAIFNLVVDEGNGDFLRLKGDAQLNGGIDASGKITLVGSYEIDEGSYDLSFNFLKRKFNIQKGSRIVWTGEPTSAQIDITATYTANTAPLDLVGNQIAGDPIIYRQKLPFDVYLMMNGELMKPAITFDIVLPSDKNYSVSTDVINTVQNRLIQLRQEPANMNKQVFALLLLNRFVGDDPFSNSANSGLDAGTFAKQSVSKLLTEQLNSLTANLIDGVDINFDVATTEDFSTGKKLDKTNFNVAVSKRLLNDRLTVTVGSNFELEGPQAGHQQNNFADNININYKLSKDGRYALRFYRKNDFTGTIEGYVVETGIGFIITVDFNKFKDLFSNKERRRKKREIKKINKEIEKKEELKTDKEKEKTTSIKKDNNEDS